MASDKKDSSETQSYVDAIARRNPDDFRTLKVEKTLHITYLNNGTLIFIGHKISVISEHPVQDALKICSHFGSIMDVLCHDICEIHKRIIFKLGQI